LGWVEERVWSVTQSGRSTYGQEKKEREEEKGEEEEEAYKLGRLDLFD
jgi:hypothetical protein